MTSEVVMSLLLSFLLNLGVKWSFYFIFSSHHYETHLPIFHTHTKPSSHPRHDHSNPNQPKPQPTPPPTVTTHHPTTIPTPTTPPQPLRLDLTLTLPNIFSVQPIVLFLGPQAQNKSKGDGRVE